jgi:hypothetical protein
MLHPSYYAILPLSPSRRHRPPLNPIAEASTSRCGTIDNHGGWYLPLIDYILRLNLVFKLAMWVPSSFVIIFLVRSLIFIRSSF